MAFCVKCGRQHDDGVNFCPNCGTQTAKNDTENRSQRQTVYEGELHKCPNCGEALNSFTITCPACGYELRGANAPDSVKEFSLRFVQTKTIREKIDLITTFAIPNTKEDILEFMILAYSNIDTDVYKSTEEKSVSKNLSDAWLAQFKQAY